MRVAALVSGGKDSLLSAYIMMQQGWEVTHLVSVFSRNRDSFMFHTPAIGMTALQAEAMGLPHVIVGTEGEKEKELEDLKKALSILAEGAEDRIGDGAGDRKGIEGVVSGAIASEYQKQRIDLICEELGLKSIAPLWHKKPEDIWSELFSSGFSVMMTGVAAQGLSKEWLGRIIDDKALEELRVIEAKHKASSVGEGGEFETLVLDCPMFRKKIVVRDYDKEWDGSAGRMIIKKAALKKK